MPWAGSSPRSSWRDTGPGPRGLADQILADARREAETIGRQADLAAKEEALRRREDIDAEADALRRDLREQEKRLEKRADLLDQKLEHHQQEGTRIRVAPAATSPSSRRSCGAQDAEVKQDAGRSARRACSGSPRSRPRRRATCC